MQESQWVVTIYQYRLRHRVFDLRERITELALFPCLMQLLQNIFSSRKPLSSLYYLVDDSDLLAFDNTTIIGERPNPETLILCSPPLQEIVVFRANDGNQFGREGWSKRWVFAKLVQFADAVGIGRFGPNCVSLDRPTTVSTPIFDEKLFVWLCLV